MKIYILFPLLFIGMVMKISAQTELHLYKDLIPNSKTAEDKEKQTTNGGILIISDISIPTYTLYQPLHQSPQKSAVIIIPGGGYFITASGHEGADIAKSFNDVGVTAIVVKYRIPSERTMINKEIGPLQDAQQAILITRQNAEKWNIDPTKIGIMGFSAGGHLASTAGTHFLESYIPNPLQTNLRPDFMILGYPVISFQDSIGHIGSRDNLIGRNPTKEKKDFYSNEMQITANTAPAFLFHASDDNVVKVANSVLFYQALVDHHIKAELHLYQNGGHGFGLNNKTTKDLWMESCRNWMRTNGWL